MQEFGGKFTPIEWNMPNNVFWNTVIKHYRNSIPVILIGFSLPIKQRFITKNWTPYIFVSVVSAVWAVNYDLRIKFHKPWDVRVSLWFLQNCPKNREIRKIYFPWKLPINLYVTDTRLTVAGSSYFCKRTW